MNLRRIPQALPIVNLLNARQRDTNTSPPAESLPPLTQIQTKNVDRDRQYPQEGESTTPRLYSNKKPPEFEN
ncbi:hypothetical protein V6N13_037507 [Hibiscus sabdariffa]